MTPRERLLTVLKGEKPDVVPWFADLSNWFNAERNRRFVPAAGKDLDVEMIEFYKEVGAGIYIELGTILDTVYDGSVEETKEIHGDTFYWTLATPLGALTEIREFNTMSWSWDIRKRMVERLHDLKIVRYAVTRRRFVPRYDKYSAMTETCGDYGVPFAYGVPYSGLGFLMSRFMGVEKTVYALIDAPDEMRETINLINDVNLQGIELLAQSPAEIILVSDNLSSDIQSPALFNSNSAGYYRKAAEIVHKAGKTFAVHLDGRVRGLLAGLKACSVDLADALTPKPTGDMTPREIRAEAGSDMILSGGVSPVAWLPSCPEKEFISHVSKWLDLRHISPRLIMSDGDQTPPGTDVGRIKLMRELVEEYGRYDA